MLKVTSLDTQGSKAVISFEIKNEKDAKCIRTPSRYIPKMCVRDSGLLESF